MDPLSVAASVAGLLSAAAAISKVLAPYTAVVRDTPQIALQVRAEIQEASIFLATLQSLTSNITSLPTQHTVLVGVDQLVAILTNGVFIFSDLEACVGDLPCPDTSSTPALRQRMQWTLKESDLKPILARLQGFKASVSLILAILQSNTLVEAEKCRAELGNNIAQLLTNAQDVSRRLMKLEAAFDRQSCVSKRPEAPSIQETNDHGILAPSDRAEDQSEDEEQQHTNTTTASWMSSFEFEDDLNISMPYRRAKRDTIDASRRNSVAFSDAWSMISGISLGDISTLAVICLPIYADEISNSRHYQFTGQMESKLENRADVTTGKQQELNEILLRLKKSVSDWGGHDPDSLKHLLYYNGVVHVGQLKTCQMYIFENVILLIESDQSPDPIDAPSTSTSTSKGGWLRIGGWIAFRDVFSITPMVVSNTRRFLNVPVTRRAYKACSICWEARASAGRDWWIATVRFRSQTDMRKALRIIAYHATDLPEKVQKADVLALKALYWY